MQSIFVFLKKLIFPLIVIFMLVVLIFAINMRLNITSYNLNQLSIQPTNQICVPTPRPPPTKIGPNTPTPSILGLKPILGPSVTPLPVSKTIDQAPDKVDEDKYYVYVWRCNGTIELYKLSQDIKIESAITLKSGDVIMFWVPAASSMGHVAPTFSASKVVPLLPTSINAAYPPPPGSPTITVQVTPYP